MIKAVIFDLDGLIIDSEPIHSKSLELLIKKYGIVPEYNSVGLLHKPGLGGENYYKEIREKYGIKDGEDRLRRIRRRIYADLIKTPLYPRVGFLPLIKDLKKRNIKIGLASNRYSAHLKTMLANMGIINFFDVIMGRKKGSLPKPAPDIYIRVAKRLKVDPKNCWALEDTEPGIISAKAAGMKALAIPNKYTGDQDFSKADLILDSLENVKWSKLNI